MTINKISKEEHDQLAKKLHQKAVMRKTLNAIFTVVVYILIAIVFIMPLFYVIGNSVRDSRAIWQNAYPISLRTFIPF